MVWSFHGLKIGHHIQRLPKLRKPVVFEICRVKNETDSSESFIYPSLIE
ncbi:MAG: hypothetical protein QXJ07_00375 [Candidatus Bathyarchaeia archaeon]